MNPRRTSPFESLESRRLLSAASTAASPLDSIIASPAGLTLSPTASASPAATAAVSGLTPAQIRQAYGIDQINFAGGIKGDGSGQTIAIVGAYNAPSILNDLKTFDAQFGLADP